MKTKTPTTAQDALLIEILGDLGELNAGVKALPEEIRASAELIHQITEKFTEDIRGIGELEKAKVSESLKMQLTKEVSATLRQLSANAKGKSPPKYRYVMALAACFLGFALAAGTGVIAAHVLYFEQLGEQAQLGRQVIANWDELNEEAKKIILAPR